MLDGLGALVPAPAESILGTERQPGPGCGQRCSFSPGDAAQSKDTGSSVQGRLSQWKARCRWLGRFWGMRFFLDLLFRSAGNIRKHQKHSTQCLPPSSDGFELNLH